MILSFVDNVGIGTKSLALFISDIVVVVFVASTGRFPPTAVVLDISDTTQYLEHDKSSSTSGLTKSKPRDCQKLLRYYNGKINSAFNILLLLGVLPLSKWRIIIKS